MTKSKPVFGRLALAATAFIWGTSFVVLKNTLDCMGTLWVLAIRFIISALLLCLLSGRRLLKMPRHILRGSVLMGICLAAAYLFQTYGLRFTTPGKNAFLTATYVVLVPFFLWIGCRRRPRAADFLAGVLCLTGIGLVSLGSADSRGLNAGDMLTLVCGIFYAVQIIIMERCVGEGDALPISALEFGTAAVIFLAGALIFEEPPSGVPLKAWGNILYLSVVCTAVCFYLQAWGMQYTPAATASVIMVFEAVFGALISVLFYHEAMSLKLICGFLFIFISVLISEVGPLMYTKLSGVLAALKEK